MGRGLGKLLAQKGANVVIVARNEQKLKEALESIAVRTAHSGTVASMSPIALTCPSPVRSQKPTNPTLPLHQRGRNLQR